MRTAMQQTVRPRRPQADDHSLVLAHWPSDSPILSPYGVVHWFARPAAFVCDPGYVAEW